MSFINSSIDRVNEEYNSLMAIFLIPLLLGAPFYGVYYAFNYKSIQTQDLVVQVCGNFEAYENNPPADKWGPKLKLTKTEENNLINLRVVSAGKDKKFYTSDDIIASRQKFKSFSRLVGNKTKDGVKNFVKGLFD